MTVDQVFIIKKLQNLDEMLVAYSAVTRMPFATCDEESFNDQVWIFTDQDKMKAFAEKYKEEKKLILPVKVQKKDASMFYMNLFSMGINEVVFCDGDQENKIELTQIVRMPDVDALPENRKPILNPQLLLSAVYFLQELRKPGVEPDRVAQQGAELIRRCGEKNIGFIDMKPLAGGAIEDGALALRYVCSNPDVTITIPGMAEIRELEENQKACENQEPLTKEEEEKIQAVRDQLGTDFCRRCNYCAPCSVGIQIPSVFLFAGYLQRYDLEQWARDRYSTLKVKASACIGCGKCEPRCPYHLPIREKLKICAADFGE